MRLLRTLTEVRSAARPAPGSIPKTDKENQQFSADRHNKRIKTLHAFLGDGDKYRAREYVKKWDWSNDEIADELYKWFMKKGF